MTATIEITPALLCWDVIARTSEAVYLRLPRELQRDIDGGCACDHCKANPELAKWDTAVISTKAPKRGNDYSHTIHMPTPSIQAFRQYAARKPLTTEAR